MADLINRGKYESDFARKVSSLMGKHRRELASLLGSPPDSRNVPFSFWQKVQKESEEEFFSLLLLIFIASSQQHSPLDSGTVFQSFMDANGEQWSKSRSQQVSAGYVQNSRDRLDQLSTKWNANPESPATKSKVTQDLISLFGPDRAEGIAITEGTNAITAGSESAAKQSGGLSGDDLWITERDRKVCPVCVPLNNQPRSVWGLKFPAGPPAHPRCRCYIEYAVGKDRRDIRQ